MWRNPSRSHRPSERERRRMTLTTSQGRVCTDRPTAHRATKLRANICRRNYRHLPREGERARTARDNDYKLVCPSLSPPCLPGSHTPFGGDEGREKGECQYFGQTARAAWSCPPPRPTLTPAMSSSLSSATAINFLMACTCDNGDAGSLDIGHCSVVNGRKQTPNGRRRPSRRRRRRRRNGF